MQVMDPSSVTTSLPPTALQTFIHTIDPTRPPPAPATATATPPAPLPTNLFDPATRTDVPLASAVPTPAAVPASQSPKPIVKRKRTFKVIIVGDAGVGKTCLSFRFCNGRFPEFTEATIGVDFRERSVHIEGETLRVQLWDTAGQERYRQSIVAHYYRNVHAVVFVYDVTCPQSFHSLPAWLAECEKHGLGANSEVPRILIGNKCDLESKERVLIDTAQIFADRNNMALFETSAKRESEADHVESIFMTLVHHLHRSKAMHVQSEKERQHQEQQVLLLKADDARIQEEGWCC